MSETPANIPEQPGDAEIIRELTAGFDRIRTEMGKIIVGQDAVVDQLMVAMFANGHVILEGVPGLAKTLMISTLARCLALSFHRVQFTPDLMPSDITGTEVMQENKATGERVFRFLPGPVFANVILADEINRTPPKTQAALLEAMQERHVTVGSEMHPLPSPFFVLATQNPIEQEGTYPLPEAQQDRFMFKVFVEYPSYEEEYRIAETTTVDKEVSVQQVFTGEQILRFQRAVRRIPVAPEVIRHALDLVRMTRPDQNDAPEIVRKMLTWGAGPRAVQAMVLGAKARAALHGRHYASFDDVRRCAFPVLRHRIITSFSASAEGYSPDRIIQELLDRLDPNETVLSKDDGYNKLLSS
ncbi:MAG: MoxR family ATPase [Planctomycetes bacterium]|nr:MoxR family ATPase [Planctomycetota bacterium]